MYGVTTLVLSLALHLEWGDVNAINPMDIYVGISKYKHGDLPAWRKGNISVSPEEIRRRKLTIKRGDEIASAG